MILQKNSNNRRSVFFLALLLGALCCGALPATAQLDVQISQHMFNRTYYNPASTGASSYINAFLLARTQWVDWEGAPETQLAAAHAYFPSLKSGIGLNLVNDRLGLERVQTAKLMYAYHAVLTEDSYLSMGLGAGIQYQSINYSRQNAVDPNDPNLTWENKSKVNPDFDFGLEYNRRQLRVGASVTHLNRSPSNDTPLSTGMHFYGYASYSIPAGISWTLVPSLFTQNSKRSSHFEGGMLAYYQQLFWLGSFFRMDDKADPESCVFMIGANVFRSLKVGYAFDFNVHRLRGYTSNSHELFLYLQLPNRMNSYSKTPRFFE